MGVSSQGELETCLFCIYIFFSLIKNTWHRMKNKLLKDRQDCTWYSCFLNVMSSPSTALITLCPWNVPSLLNLAWMDSCWLPCTGSGDRPFWVAVERARRMKWLVKRRWAFVHLPDTQWTGSSHMAVRCADSGRPCLDSWGPRHSPLRKVLAGARVV